MKRFSHVFAAIAALGAVCLLTAATFTVPSQALRSTAPVSSDLLVTNVNATVPLTLKKAAGFGTNFFEFYEGGVLRAALGTNGLLSTAYGGTGAATANAGFAALAPFTTRGDLVYRNATVPARLAIGAANRVLRSDGTDPSWAQVALATDVSGTLPVANGGTGAATVAGAKTALGIQAGTVTTADDGTVTNTFATAFSVAPAVVTGLTASNSPTNNITSVTTTNFVVAVGEAAVVVQWIAVGAP